MPTNGLCLKAGLEKTNSASIFTAAAVASRPPRNPSFWKLPEALPIWELSSRKLSASETVTGEEVEGFKNERASSRVLAMKVFDVVLKERKKEKEWRFKP